MSAREEVERVLDLLPMSDDGTGHVAYCGYDEDHPACGCYSLPDRVGAVLDEVRADARRRVLAEAQRRIEAWIRHGEAVPADVTTYERWIVNEELRGLLRGMDEAAEARP